MKTKKVKEGPVLVSINDIMSQFSDGGPIKQAFHLMGIAEEEIAAGQRRHPSKAKEIHKAAFMAVQPYHKEFWRAPDNVYRAHCREIIDRVAAGAKLEIATDAEILYGLYSACQKAPPGDHFSLLYQRLFIKIFPDQKIIKNDSLFRESWPQAVEEMYYQFRVKLRVEKRGEIPEEIRSLMTLVKS